MTSLLQGVPSPAVLHSLPLKAVSLQLIILPLWVSSTLGVIKTTAVVTITQQQHIQ